MHPAGFEAGVGSLLRDEGSGPLEIEIVAHEDDLLDVIVAYRKKRGRRDIGDQLARELLRDARDQ